jgi:hypothetical protein
MKNKKCAYVFYFNKYYSLGGHSSGENRNNFRRTGEEKREESRGEESL